MTIEQLREWLVEQIADYTHTARAERNPEMENRFVRHVRVLQSVVDKIDSTYSDEEEG